MRITKSQLRQIIKEEIQNLTEEQEYEVKIGKDLGRGKRQKTSVFVMATSRDDALEKAKEHPVFKKDGYEYAMYAAPESLDTYD